MKKIRQKRRPGPGVKIWGTWNGKFEGKGQDESIIRISFAVVFVAYTTTVRDFCAVHDKRPSRDLVSVSIRLRFCFLERHFHETGKTCPPGGRMEKDFRIHEVADLTRLTHNYVYTCLKRMPEIFRGLVSTGQHNARIFSPSAVEIFRRVAYLKIERMWSIAQIRNYLGRNGPSNILNSCSTDDGGGDRCPDSNCTDLVLAFNHSPTAALIETITEKERLIDELRIVIEEKNRLLSEKDRIIAGNDKLLYSRMRTIEERESEISGQRRRSDAIVMELTSQLSRLLAGFGPLSKTVPLQKSVSGGIEDVHCAEGPIFEAVKGADPSDFSVHESPPGHAPARRKATLQSKFQDSGHGLGEGGMRE